MITRRLIVTSMITAFLSTVPCPALAAAPDWQPVGGDDAIATGLVSPSHLWRQVFLTTPEGYRTYNWIDDAWASFEEPGVPGREMTAVTGVPRLQQRLLTGRFGADGHGRIEIGSGPSAGSTVHTSRAGAVTALLATGYFTPLLLACTRASAQIPGEFLASADTGATWQEFTGHGHHDVTDLFAGWTNEIYVAGDAGVMLTRDGGSTWQSRNAGLPAGTVRRLWTDGPAIAVPGVLATDMIDQGQLFAAMDDGVYYTLTDSVAWQLVLAEAEPRQIVYQSHPYGGPGSVLVVTADGRLLEALVDEWQWTDLTGNATGGGVVGVVSIYPELCVATQNGGLFRAQHFLHGSDVPALDDRHRLAAAPNPFNGGTVVSFEAPRSLPARLSIHDLRGRLVATLLDDVVDVGAVSRTWDPRDLASGVYVARLELDGVVSTRRLMLLK